MTTDARLDEIEGDLECEEHGEPIEPVELVLHCRELLTEVRRLREIERLARQLVEGIESAVIRRQVGSYDLGDLEQALAPERTAPQ